MTERQREQAPPVVSGGAEAANEAGRAALKGLAPEAPKPPKATSKKKEA